jgi:hypothetical protein
MRRKEYDGRLVFARQAADKYHLALAVGGAAGMEEIVRPNGGLAVKIWMLLDDSSCAFGDAMISHRGDT